MHATPSLQPRQNRPEPNRARITSWARLWLACIATLLTCAAHLLPPAHRRRLPLLDLPRAVLARLVARLILICAVEQAAPPKRAQLRALMEAGALRALLRAGLHHHLTNTHGAYDLAQIERTCANPETAIADMRAALARGLTRRASILPRATCDALHAQAAPAPPFACDSS
jgi:hypothetical protein